MVMRFDRNAIRTKPRDLLEAFRDRLLDIVLRKLHNVPALPDNDDRFSLQCKPSYHLQMMLNLVVTECG